ncbi:homeobox protein prospero-like protein [Dinothrombium tinctorium]|uniref:Homeobox protein prospero-like protein n=1 Tax=Dinothrombium tinctorium TaxID=1965070 RepID=A0A443RRV5_9ACAR|nr:homeobox protein prospero-like protein [Dinothrombium tinctorium]RWS17978.1 homeobox protein prospero-like protein [Dinothrombium tinctorium]RWS17984.1 homeobox protein prospero-like protein [Dinothrombium tinctorium]
MSSEDDSCTSAGSGSTSTMELLQEPGAGHPHSHASLSQVHPPLHHHQTYHHLQSTALKVSSNAGSSYKVKRTRQRVDAGEPRNSYASITNFSSQRFNNFHHQTSPTSSSTYHQYNGLSNLSSPVNNKLLQHHVHELPVAKSLSIGDTNNNSGGFKSNYTLASTATTTSATTATTNSERDMILFDESVLQLCASTATGGQMPAYVNGNSTPSSEANANGKGNQLTELENNSLSPVKEKCGTSPRAGETSAHLLRDILQTGRKLNDQSSNSKTGSSGCEQPHSPNNGKVGGNMSQCSDASDAEEEDLNEEDTSRDCSEQDEANMNSDKTGNADKLGVTGDSPSGSRSSSPFTEATSAATNNNQSNNHSTSNGSSNNPSSGSNNSSNISEVKRARVENIVSNMLLGNSSTNSNGSANTANGSTESGSKGDSLPVNGCKKRKLYQPQQSKLNSEEDDDEEDDVREEIGEEEATEEDDFTDEITDLSAKKVKSNEKSEDKENLRQQLEEMQAQLFEMKHRYVQIIQQQQQQQQRLQRDQNLQQLSNRSSTVAFQSPVNLTTSASPVLREDEENDLDDNLSDKAQTPVSQTSDNTNRDTPANSSANLNISSISLSNANAIQDPAQFLDEARRILSEQERLASKEGLRNTRNQSTQPISAAFPDVECLCEALKSELQSNIFPTILQMIDSTVSRFFQRSDPPAKISPNLEQTSPANKDLTILSQMLESKSSRTGGKVSDRGPSHANSSLQSKPINNPSRSSPFTLPTESAPAPKPSGPSPFAFPPSNFKSPFFLPNIGHGGSQPAQPGLMPPNLAHHFNTIASALSQHSRDQNTHSASSAQRDNKCNTSNGSNSASKERSERDVPSNRDIPVPEQTEAIPLVVAPKRKRHKVTDTRITPRTVSRILGQEPLLSGIMGRDIAPGSPPNPGVFSHHGPSAPPPPLVPVSLPTSVAIPNPSLHQTDLFPGPAFTFADPTNRFGFYTPQLALEHHDENENEKDTSKNNAAAAAVSAVSSALAAHHLSMLAAANRGSPDSLHGYQSSGLVRSGGGVGSDSGNNDGSEVSFNESSQYEGTMPMISFSYKYGNIESTKEFYYIQMEKYARQAIGEGIKNAEDIQVSNDSELIRVLNLHYNRNNHIEVPEHFRFVVEQTLREFFKAVMANKDQEQSWKKAIYKVIARLDDNVPEYFKSPNFLEQLE